MNHNPNEETNIGLCRYCYQFVRFAVTTNGRVMPVELDLAPFRADGGKSRFLDKDGVTHLGSVVAPDQAEAWLWLQHFSVCKRTKEFLKAHPE